MAITVAQLQSDLDAARTALVASDFATAQTYARAALAVIAGLPDTEFGESKVAWRESINELLKACDRGLSQQAVSNAGGIRRTLVTYIRPTS